MLKLTSLILIFVLMCTPFTAQTKSSKRPMVAKVETAVAKPTKTLPLKRLVLYSNGVAYFERRGTVTDNAEVELPFKQSQVDDVLKSMVVLDLGKGKIGAVSYNSSAPPSARLNEIPFSIESGTEDDSDSVSHGLAGVLSQLQGARVAVNTGVREAIGSILTIEKRKIKDDQNEPERSVERLVIASDSGELSSFDLSEVKSVRLLDDVAKHDVKEFTDASASARRRDAKTIVISSDGTGPREMVVSYTLAAPIWKTSYRVVLDDSGKPFFQGWAIVDNVSDEDWRDVSLSLVSGSPVSFIQPIQQPLYRYRPVVPIPKDLNLTPQVYEPATSVASPMSIPGGVPGGVAGGVPGNIGGSGFGTGSGSGGGRGPGDRPGQPKLSISDAMKTEETGIETSATGNEVGALFEYKVDRPITVQRNRSALIPILQTRLEGEHISIYNERSQSNHPMSGLRLKNTSSLTLEGGPLTVIDGDAYAGEALMERLKPGEERFISYALDLGTLVTTNQKDDREPVFLVRAINGAFQTHFYQTQKKTYTIANQTDKPQVVYIEHPIQQGWMLSDQTQKPIEKTATVYRFRLEIGPRATVEFPVVLRQALMETYALSNLTTDNLQLFVSKRYIDDETRGALQHILDLKAQIASINSRIADADKELSEIDKDQARLRDNIKALKETTQAGQLITRYIAKANEQETRVEELTATKKKLNEEQSKLNGELDRAIRSLTLDRKLS